MSSSLRLYIDTEFTSLEHPEGLSIGIVADDGREFYCEVDLRTRLGGKLLKRCGSFVVDEVVSQFGQRPQSIAEPTAIGARLADWLIKLKVAELEVVYDYSADYELLERWLQSAAAAHKVPKLVPTHVGYQLDQADALAAQEASWSVSESADGLRRHHALADARALRAAFRAVHDAPVSFDAQGLLGCNGVDVDALDDAVFELDTHSIEQLEGICDRLNLLAANGLDDTLPVADDAPLVFLDLDDVVCLSEFHGGYDAVDAVTGRHTHAHRVYATLFHLPALQVLQDLHEAMGGQLRYVITSTWRKYLNRSQMVEVLARSGLPFVAERIERKGKWSTVDWPHRTRLSEIAEWLERNWSGEPYVVIDDDYSGQSLVPARDAPRGPFRDRIVLCKERVGLLPEHLPQLLTALRTKPQRPS
jgi:hypothetical protein